MKEIVIAAAMGLMLAQQTGQQTSVPLPSSPAPQQTIPDAPRPQTTGLADVAPGKGTTATSNDLPGRDAPSDPDQPAVGAALGQRPATPDTDPGPPPDQPVEGKEGTGAYAQLGPLRVNYVEIPFTVKDRKGGLVPALTWRDVRVYENNQRQQIRVFSSDPAPLSLALVIDQSLDFKTMERVNNSLGALEGAFAPYDQVAVFTYNNGPKMQTDFTAGQSARLTAVVERSKSTGRDPIFYDTSGPMAQGIKLNGDAQDHINPLTSGGPGSPQGLSQQQVPREAHTLNDAILEAAKATTHAAKGRRRVVYVISDGKEYGSKAKAKEVIKYLQTNKISVFATLVGDASVEGLGFLDHIHLPLTVRDNILPVYTAATGGQTFAEYRTKGIESSFAKITEEVRVQYTVGYYSREPFIDGKFRKVEVRVMRPNLNVIAKDGYYPTADDARPAAVRPVSATP